MTVDTFQGWTYHLSDVADHTWVRVPGKGDFRCWGGTSGDGDWMVNEGTGKSYAVANDYRMNIGEFHDTAQIVYGVTGVCHQTANRYMLPARTMLDWRVRGYWASTILYGGHGGGFDLWFVGVYTPICIKHGVNPFGDSIGEAAGEFELTELDMLLDVHAKAPAGTAPAPHKEAELLAGFRGHHEEYDTIKAKHRNLIETRDDVLAKDGVESAVSPRAADQINAALKDFQADAVAAMGREAFERVSGQAADDRLSVIDPSIVAALHR